MCPIVLRPGRGLMCSREMANDMYVDIGLYGEPKVSDYNSAIARDMELFVLKLNG